MHIGTNMLTKPKDIAESFNTYFINATKPLAKHQTEYPIDTDVDFPLIALQNFVNTTKLTSPDTKNFQIPLVTNEFVQKQPQSLNTHKAKGVDGIGPYFLKIAAEIISPSIGHISLI